MADRLWRHLRHQSSGRQEAKRYLSDDGIEGDINALRADKEINSPEIAGVIKLTERLKYAKFQASDPSDPQLRYTRDPEDRQINEADPLERRDKMLDKTIADTFPASDPPSSLPDPDEDSFAIAS